MKADLVPLGYKRIILTVRWISIVLVLLTIFLLSIFAIVDTNSVYAKIYFSAGILLVVVPTLIPGLLYGRLCCSTAVFSSCDIQVLNKRGHCWRTISYDDITDIRVDEISGFFYGRDKHQIKCKFICFFLNNLTEVPETSLAKRFREKDFFMVCYREEDFKKICSLISINTSLKNWMWDE